MFIYRILVDFFDARNSTVCKTYVSIYVYLTNHMHNTYKMPPPHALHRTQKPGWVMQHLAAPSVWRSL